jgi:hypothetical protein
MMAANVTNKPAPARMEMRRARRGAATALLAAGCLCAHLVRAQEEEPKKAPSPWILLPTFTNSPKLGTSVGALAAYVLKFDAASQVSMFGVNAQYTSTDSATVGAFARTSLLPIITGSRWWPLAAWRRLRRLLGTGVPLKSEDHIRGLGRYLYRVKTTGLSACRRFAPATRWWSERAGR